MILIVDGFKNGYDVTNTNSKEWRDFWYFKNGRTLMSIQNILHQSIYAKTGIHVNILLDASNYKEKKQKNIEYMAKKLAKEVVQTGIEIKMDSMNSYERHLVHDVLSNYRGVKTESEGEEPNRCVVIKPSK